MFLYLWPWLGPTLTQCDVMYTFDFVDDVMFSHNRANRQNQKRCVFRTSLQVAAPGAKSAFNYNAWVVI